MNIMEKFKMWSKKYRCFVTAPNGIIIAGGKENKGLLYSEDNGRSWRQSNINYDRFSSLAVINKTIIAGSDSGKGLYYSDDNGKTWNQSNVKDNYFSDLMVIDNVDIVIACCNYGNWTFCSENDGHAWYMANIDEIGRAHV